MYTFAERPKAAKPARAAKSTLPIRPWYGQSPHVNAILHQQSLIGNRAVRELLSMDLVARQQPAAAGAPPTFQIVYGSDFHQTADGVSLDATLLANVNSLCDYLIQNHLVHGNIRFNQGVRSRVKAHRWSTAYAIRQGKVPPANLQALQDGKDADGNLWYKEGWTQEEIIDHAKTIWNGAKAAEGYPKNDARRLPNTGWVNVSNHVAGNAMDVSIPWTIGPWSAQAKQIVADHGLGRPVPTEAWHFQLA